MKNRIISTLFLAGILLTASCKSGFEHSKAGMERLSEGLVAKFGAATYYTDIEFLSKPGSDDIVMVTETNEPASMKQEQWLQYSGGEWEKQADVHFTADGADPKAFMFQLNKEVSLSKMGDLLEAAKAQLLKDKQVKAPVFVSAVVKSNNKMNSKEGGIFYYIILNDNIGKRDYQFVYDLQGNLQTSSEN
jgi:hypothetical protein